MIVVPVTNQPNQSFTMVIPRPDNSNMTLQFFINWNSIAQYWQMSIRDLIKNIKLLDSWPLVSTQILSQLQYLNIGSAYLVPITTGTRGYPGLTDWGNDFALVWD